MNEIIENTKKLIRRSLTKKQNYEEKNKMI